MTSQVFDYSKLTELPFGLPGRIFRSPMPFGSYDPRKAVLGEALKEGVSVVVDLVPDEESEQKTGKSLRKLYAESGLKVIYAPIVDFNVPEAKDLVQSIADVQGELGHGKNIMVHCNAGFGRTGLFLGCLAREVLGFDGPGAVAWVREYIPTALENELQVNFVCTWK